MSAPERIWAWIDYDGNWDGTWLAHSETIQPHRLPDAQYIRADLVPQWQPIETAPRDGARILAYWPDALGNMSATQVESWFGPRGAAWGEGACWQSAYEWGDGSNDPTHWMPLPTPPEAD